MGLNDLQAAIGLVGAQPRRAVNYTVRALVLVTGRPQVFPGLIVPEGLFVTLTGHNGIAAGNVALVRVANYPEDLNNFGGNVIIPGGSLAFPVDHLAQVWFVGTAGDGLIANIGGVPIG